jgi:hypothetical protein
MKILKSLYKTYKLKEKEHTLSTRKEVILLNLSDELSVEDSIALFEDINNTFINKLERRLDSINKEKGHIEQFLTLKEYYS